MHAKLSELSAPSYFAVHFSYLKATPSPVPQTHFLAYFRIDPKEERVFLVGLLPMKLDTEFWLTYQEGESGQFKHKECELEAVRMMRRSASDLQHFVEEELAGVPGEHRDYEYMSNK